MCHIRLNDETKTDVVVKYLWIYHFSAGCQTHRTFITDPKRYKHTTYTPRSIGTQRNRAQFLCCKATLNDAFDDIPNGHIPNKAHLHLSPIKPHALHIFISKQFSCSFLLFVWFVCSFWWMFWFVCNFIDVKFTAGAKNHKQITSTAFNCNSKSLSDILQSIKFEWEKIWLFIEFSFSLTQFICFWHSKENSVWNFIKLTFETKNNSASRTFLLNYNFKTQRKIFMIRELLYAYLHYALHVAFICSFYCFFFNLKRILWYFLGIFSQYKSFSWK